MRLKDFRGKSLGEILDLNRGAGLGFDFLRIGLALLIVLSHASGLSGHQGTMTGLLNGVFHINSDMASRIAQTAAVGVDADPIVRPITGLGRPITLAYVPMFFALSGFLVTGSALRTRQLLRFLGLRALRILPALFVEVVLSGVVLGSIFTTLPLGEYFRSPLFYAYFLNIVGDIHFYLPGVFEHTSSYSAVNSNLWTLPSELHCYLLMAILMVSTLLYRRMLFTVLYFVCTIVFVIANSFYGFQVVAAQLPGPVIVFYFVTGVMFYTWRYKIIFHEGLFFLSAAICYPLMLFTKAVYLYPIFLTYVTVFIGLAPFPQFKLLKSGDYSYGVYLYGAPVTQAIIAAFPGIKSNLPLLCISALAATAVFAAFSWHAVEKHVLKLKRFLSPSSYKITERLHADAMAPARVERGIGVAPVETGRELTSRK